MGRQQSTTKLSRVAIENYLRRRYGDGIRLVDVEVLGESDCSVKEYGYGRPLAVSFRAEDALKRVVIRTMSPDPFGHNRRSDRVSQMVLAYDCFNDTPRHIDAKDVGLVGEDGELISIASGQEPFLVSDYVEGTLYAADLKQLSKARSAGRRDLRRAETLARYLSELHEQPAPNDAYDRALRDVVGSGEGIFGLCDSYRVSDPIATRDRLQSLEHAAVAWRWKLRELGHRCRRTHGDFHPFNLLFRHDEDFTVLDCSRGAAGEPADDVTCLSINYLFFSLIHHGALSGAYKQLWDVFWNSYLKNSRDRDILQVVAPFFAWRALVLASPVWYPNINADVRNRILSFAERLLQGTPFEPTNAADLLS